MENSHLHQTIEEVKEKYHSQGQDPSVHLTGLKYTKPITYWDYCEVDTLLSLQKTRTTLADEQVFILYHQINELLFKMILSEMEQIAHHPGLTKSFFSERLARISRYFDVLSSSFDIMTDGMEVEQYMKFRTVLTPASGFQSAQYRKIEICCTDFENLIDLRYRNEVLSGMSWTEKFTKVYWRAAGFNPKTNERTLTLALFEDRYLEELTKLAADYQSKNLWRCFLNLPPQDQADDELVKVMRHLDNTINLKWVMAHYKAASKYLDSGPEQAKATGGSEWKKYMHPQYQKRIFFPKLWTEEERSLWGQKSD